jgi:Holliday junction regulator protein family C-terminal repeat
MKAILLNLLTACFILYGSPSLTLAAEDRLAKVYVNNLVEAISKSERDLGILSRLTDLRDVIHSSGNFPVDYSTQAIRFVAPPCPSPYVRSLTGKLQGEQEKYKTLLHRLDEMEQKLLKQKESNKNVVRRQLLFALHSQLDESQFEIQRLKALLKSADKERGSVKETKRKALSCEAENKKMKKEYKEILNSKRKVCAEKLRRKGSQCDKKLEKMDIENRAIIKKSSADFKMLKKKLKSSEKKYKQIKQEFDRLHKKCTAPVPQAYSDKIFAPPYSIYSANQPLKIDSNKKAESPISQSDKGIAPSQGQPAVNRL